MKKPRSVDLTGLFRADATLDPLLRDATLPDGLFVSRARPRSRSSSAGRGAIVDKYRLDEVLGTGGFAVVWLATHLLLRTQVALKLLRSDVLDAPGSVHALVEEARCVARIQHANVVRIVDVTHTPAISYIVMEYIDGPTLSRAIELSGPRPWREVADIGAAVASGLGAALRDDIIHRDVKPANILLPKAGGAKLVDFGLARVTARAHSSGAGTRGYMAPEVVRGRASDYRADIFSLGITLLEALLGRRWRANNDLGSALHHVPPPMAALVTSIIDEAPQRRPESYEVIRRTLEDIR